MRDIESWAIGYLVNSLWMVPLVFAAAWMAARAARRVSPRAEHRVWVTALFLQVLLPGVQLHLIELWRMARVWMLRGTGVGPDGDARITVVTRVGQMHSGLHLPQGVITMLGMFYACSVLFFAARLAWGLWRTYAMRRESEPVERSHALAERWLQHSLTAGVEGAGFALTPRVHGPATVGMRRGVLLAPPGFFDAMEPCEMDAVMAHECAHLRRHDFAKNVLYNVVALPVSYHPLLWLTRTRLAESREMVCDAIAAEAVASRESYARSLLRLASMMMNSAPVESLHAIGIFDANSLERRVMNLMRRSERAGRALRLAALGACVAIGAVTCASALALRMDVGAEKSEKPTALRVRSEVLAGNALYQKTPVYPAEARANKDTVDGPVVLDVIISKEGSIRELRVKQSLRRDYDLSAMDAVKEWRYKPFLLNGEPTEVQTTITVNYSIGE